MANDVKRADLAARNRMATTPRALAVCVASDGRLQVELSDGHAILLLTSHVEGLERATHDDLANVEITPSGYGLHFPTVDADVYLPGLLEGHFGSARYMAAAMGSRGGQARSEAKSAASRENGRLGGRPRKHMEA